MIKIMVVSLNLGCFAWFTNHFLSWESKDERLSFPANLNPFIQPEFYCT